MLWPEKSPTFYEISFLSNLHVNPTLCAQQVGNCTLSLSTFPCELTLKLTGHYRRGWRTRSKYYLQSYPSVCATWCEKPQIQPFEWFQVRLEYFFLTCIFKSVGRVCHRPKFLLATTDPVVVWPGLRKPKKHTHTQKLNNLVMQPVNERSFLRCVMQNGRISIELRRFFSRYARQMNMKSNILDNYFLFPFFFFVLFFCLFHHERPF